MKKVLPAAIAAIVLASSVTAFAADKTVDCKDPANKDAKECMKK